MLPFCSLALIKDILSGPSKKQGKQIQQFLPSFEPRYLSLPPCTLHLVIACREHSAFQHGVQGSGVSMMSRGDLSLAVHRSPCSHLRYILNATTLTEYQGCTSSNTVWCMEYKNSKYIPKGRGQATGLDIIRGFEAKNICVLWLRAPNHSVYPIL